MTKLRFRNITDAEEAADQAELQSQCERDEKERMYQPKDAVHDNLRRFRIRMNLKKQEMAELMEVTARSYYAYEAGKRAIPSTAIVKLAVLTAGDLNEILLGRPAPNNEAIINSAIDDMMQIMQFLGVEYPNMDMRTRLDVARFSVTFNWQGAPRLHPENIREAVKVVTRYRFHPENLPRPPFWEDYGERQDLYDEDIAEWQKMVDEDLGTQTGGTSQDGQ